MNTSLRTFAEQAAHRATSRAPFAINLREIRRTVEEILGQVGRFSFFDTYTKHDISHVDEMLGQLEWLISEDVRKVMTDADWILIVLSAYFHDLGMLITKTEFENRQHSGFGKFCEEHLFVGEGGQDYRGKVDALPPEQRDRFLYEEFVRFHHGVRVRGW